MTKIVARRHDVYDAPQRIEEVDGKMRARIDGSDGRTTWLSLDGFPARALHVPFLEAFVRSTGPTTSRKSSGCAKSMQWAYRRILAFLEHRHGPEVSIDQITENDVRAYRDQIVATDRNKGDLAELRLLTMTLFELNYCSAALWEVARESVYGRETRGVGGLSPEGFKEVLAAATRDVQAIAERIRAGEALLDAFLTRPETLTPEQKETGSSLHVLASGGPAPRTPRIVRGRARNSGPHNTVPPMLFPVLDDMTPILVLLACVTGRNSETLKELQSDHTVRDGLIVETTAIKRRRSYESETVEWEIGSRSRQWKTAGGVYLLVHDLCRRSRELANTTALLSAWNRHRDENRYPWHARLSNVGAPDLPNWALKHGLEEHGAPIHLTFGRIKTAVERQRAQKSEFDMDRAAVTNTPDVLYRSYISPDQDARAELESITSAALRELQQRFIDGRSALTEVPLHERPPITSEPDAVTTAFMQCRNVLGSPDYPGVECAATMLDCFGCPCAVVGDENIPTILKLSEEIEERFHTLPFETWIRRFGQSWLAIHTDILPSRSAQEIAIASSKMPERTALSLLDEPEMF